MSGGLKGWLAIGALVALPAVSGAQAAPPAGAGVEPEVRLDLVLPRAGIEAGAGMQVPMGYYVRLGADLAVGARGSPLSAAHPTGRIDLLGRFLLDPFRQSPFGVSAGAGISTRFESGTRATPLLLVALDVEGRRAANGWVPALQLGLGGGTRIGVVLRRAQPGYR
jgi:hypothetical protein